MDRICFKGEFGWLVLLLTLGFSSPTAVALAQTADIPELPPVWTEPVAPSPQVVGIPLLSPAPPFRIMMDGQTRERAATCLSTAIYYEAASQSREGQEAVAQVVLNRVRHPNYPKSVCGVVYQGAEHRGCQFTFACDGSLKRIPSVAGWRMAQAVANQALDGFVATAVGDSTHYHTMWVHPVWSTTMTLTRRIGAHQFYRFPKNSALSGVYAGFEPAVDVDALMLAGDGVGFKHAPGGQGSSSVVAKITPQSSTFNAWGLQIATVTPLRSGAITVSDVSSPRSPASTATAARNQGSASAAGMAAGS